MLEIRQRRSWERYNSAARRKILLARSLLSEHADRRGFPSSLKHLSLRMSIVFVGHPKREILFGGPNTGAAEDEGLH